MSNFNLATTSAFWLLLILPGLYLAARSGLRVRSTRLALFMDLAVFKKLVPDAARPMTAVRAALLTAFLFFILAALRPQGAGDPQTAEVQGLNLAFALDVSQSMLASDAQPSRLEQARRMIHDVLDYAPGARVSLVVFAGTAFVEVPLTNDRNALETALADVGPDLVPIPGTRLLPALERAIQTLGLREDSNAANPAAAIMLISDGENFKEDLSGALKRLRVLRVPVFTVGAGTLEGAPVPETRKKDTQGFKRDKQGQIVLSKLNEAGLQELAKQTRGEYFRLKDGFVATAGLSKAIAALSSRSNLQKMRTFSRSELYQWPLLVGLVLFVFAKRRYRATILAACLLWLGFLPLAAHAEDLLESGNQLLNEGDIEGARQVFDQALQADPANPALLIARGNAHYRDNNFQAALADYERAAHNAPENSNLQLRALYNAGNALAQLEKYEAAAARYEEALKIDGKDKEVAANLEYVRRKQNQPPQNQDQKEQQQDEKKEKGKENGKGQQQDQQQKDEQEKEKEKEKSQGEKEKERERERTKEETEAMLGNLEEKHLQMLKHRYRKALEDLEKHDQQVPNEDW